MTSKIMASPCLIRRMAKKALHGPFPLSNPFPLGTRECRRFYQYVYLDPLYFARKRYELIVSRHKQTFSHGYPFEN